MARISHSQHEQAKTMVDDISWCTMRPAESMADNIHLLKLFVVSILQELQRLVYSRSPRDMADNITYWNSL